MVFTQKKYQDYILAVYLIKLKQIVFYRGESTYKFIETILEEFHYLNKY